MEFALTDQKPDDSDLIQRMEISVIVDGAVKMGPTVTISGIMGYI